ncbi:MAG: HAD family hydrolase, partial [Actinomycetia bacterium]|nr:HAD family hydrolase [Actinomycetes bacterium]
VFDFDGTLCDSADVKTDAFYDLYLEEQGPKFADKVLSYHLKNAGVSRYDKIRYVESELIGTPPSEQRVDDVADRFSSLVEDAVVAAPLFDGVIEFLTSLHGDFPVAIASATPTAELRRITDRKGISRFFSEIEGSPRSKDAILAGLASQYGVAPDETVMVGDQPSDARGGQAAGASILLIAPDEDWTVPFDRVDTFKDAAVWLNQRCVRT